MMKKVFNHSKKNNFFLLLLISLFLIFPKESFAFQSDFKTVITPSRVDVRKEKTSATISVVTKKELEKQNAVSVEEALRNLPGVFVQSSGTPGEQTFVRLRGADGDQILVLVDGVQVNSPWNGYFDFADLTTDNIERIEVVKGNQSALYGSEAVGGVINIITKKGKGGLKSSAKVGAGNQGTFREEFNNQRGWEKFNYSFSASRTDSEGQHKSDSYDNTSVSGRAELKLSENMSIAFTGRYTKANKEIPVDFYGLSSTLMQSYFDDNWENRKEFLLNNLTLKHNPKKWWNYTIQGSYLEDELVLDNKASPEFNLDVFYTLKADRLSIRNQHDFYIGESDVITLGVDYKKESADRLLESPEESQIKEDREDLAFYLQNMWSYENAFFLTVGIRGDDYSDFGSTYNPKVSAAYRFPKQGTKIKASWGTGFVAPSIQELYTPRLGNPDLKPEKTESYEIGIEQQLPNHNVSMELVYFHIDFEDLIERSQTGVDNVGKAKTEGVEFSISYSPIPNLDLSGNYTYQNAENKDTGTPLSRPENIWHFNAFYTYKEKLSVNLDINLVGEKYDDLDFLWVDGTLLEGPVEAYEKIDLAVTYLIKRWSLTNELKFFTKVNNLLDQNYFENKGFKASGINFLSGLRLTF